MKKKTYDEEKLLYITQKVEEVIEAAKKDNLNLTTKGIVHLVFNLLEEIK